MKKGMGSKGKLLIVLCLILSVVLIRPILQDEVSYAEGGGTISGMQGVLPPDGSIAYGSNTYGGMTANNVLDSDIESFWNSGSASGALEVRFPKEVYLEFVQLAASSNPKTDVTYKVYGLQSNKWVEISGNLTKSVENHITKTYTILDPFVVTPGKYSGVRIVCTGSTTWIAISGITIGSLTPEPTIAPTTAPTPTVTPQPTVEPTSTPTVTPSPTPEQPTGDRAILVVTMNTGLEKEFDLPMSEVNAFLNWYDTASGTTRYGINKHDNNKGPFNSRKEYVIFDKILTFSVNEYSAK
ncbi:discoidin domain-containing protein [Paenibacillus sp. P46E]|uniref:discoidin domain-containing protein n=1 Tax=Paenibacillus sp. P46E TaxID=1349436 RepID=UPI000A79BD1D|nr:discoidin domain-containing protein [Paenibacillus sp. P46E]